MLKVVITLVCGHQNIVNCADSGCYSKGSIFRWLAMRNVSNNYCMWLMVITRLICR